MATIVSAPDGGYGWLIVMTSFVANYVYASMVVTYSMLMVELSETFDVNAATVGWGGSFAMGVASLSGVPVGLLVHKYGARPVCMIGGLIGGIGMFGTSFVTNIYTVYFTYGLLTGLGQGAVKLSSLLVVQQYFDKRRAFATGISLVGSSLAGVTWTPIFRVLTGHLGWRGAVGAHGCLVVQAVALGATYRPLRSTKPVPQKLAANDVIDDKSQMAVADRKKMKTSSTRSLFRNYFFTVYTLCNTLIYFGLLNMYLQGPSRAVFYGLSKTQASLLPSAIGLFSTISRLAYSLVLGVVGGAHIHGLLLFGMFASLGGLLMLLSFLGQQDFTSSVAFCAAYGLNLGVMVSVQPTVLVELVGIDMAAMALGWFQFLVGCASLAALPFSGWLFDITQGYDLPYYVSGCLHMAGGLVTTVMYAIKRRNDARYKGLAALTIEPKEMNQYLKKNVDMVYGSALSL